MASATLYCPPSPQYTPLDSETAAAPPAAPPVTPVAAAPPADAASPAAPWAPDKKNKKKTKKRRLELDDIEVNHGAEDAALPLAFPNPFDWSGKPCMEKFFFDTVDESFPGWEAPHDPPQEDERAAWRLYRVWSMLQTSPTPPKEELGDFWQSFKQRTDYDWMMGNFLLQGHVDTWPNFMIAFSILKAAFKNDKLIDCMEHVYNRRASERFGKLFKIRCAAVSLWEATGRLGDLERIQFLFDSIASHMVRTADSHGFAFDDLFEQLEKAKLALPMLVEHPTHAEIARSDAIREIQEFVASKNKA